MIVGVVLARAGSAPACAELVSLSAQCTTTWWTDHLPGPGCHFSASAGHLGQRRLQTVGALGVLRDQPLLFGGSAWLAPR